MSIGSEWNVSHDFFYQLGGAERVSAVLATDVVPGAKLLALAGSRSVTEQLGLPSVDFVGGGGYTSKNYRLRSLSAPVELPTRRAVEGNLLASSYAYAHMLRATGQTYVYCHSPLRQIWSGTDMYASSSRFFSLGLGAVAPLMRAMDKKAARHATAYIANSAIVARRIREFYGFEPWGVIPPPVDDRFFSAFGQAQERREDTIVFAGRLVEPYKKVSLLIEAIRGTRFQLIVAGTGRDEIKLKSMAPSNVQFVGHKSPSELASLYSTCQFLVFPSEDDFGMVPPEAMASGTPVLALGRGGALETVVPGATGFFFEEPTVASLRLGLEIMGEQSWDYKAIRARAMDFSVSHFVENVRLAIGAEAGEKSPQR